MKQYLLSVFTLVAMLMAHTAIAVRVSTIYQGEIPVAAQSDAVKKQVLPQALNQVFIKVTGNSKILDNETLKSHLKDANSLVQEFGYAASNNPAQPFLLTIQFDSEGINKILRDAAAPIWGMNRPLILTWIEHETTNHPPEIIDSSSNNEIQSSLKQHANLRGVPIIFPVMDVSDLNQVSAHDIATADIPKLQNASKRYASDALLIAGVTQTTDGFSAQGKLVLANNQWDVSVSGKTLTETMSALMDKVADTLAQQLATVVTNAEQGKLEIKVTGISQQDDFSQMMRYLQHLAPVSDVQIVEITGDNVTLNITLHSKRESFTQILALGNKLSPVQNQSNDQLLVYQWNH